MAKESFIEYKGKTIKRLKGTEQDDAITLNCPEMGDFCTYTVNGQSETFAKSSLPAYQLSIDPLAGQDALNLTIGKGKLLLDVQIFLDNGDKTLFSKFIKPYSSASVFLGKEYSHTLRIDEEGSNIFIRGFKNSPNNKIEFLSNKYSLTDLRFEKDNPNSETFDLYLAGNPVCTFFNQLTPKEYELYAQHQILIQDEASIPDALKASEYVLNGPKPMDELLNAEHFSFTPSE